MFCFENVPWVAEKNMFLVAVGGHILFDVCDSFPGTLTQ
jgi:hypothetical protein